VVAAIAASRGKPQIAAAAPATSAAPVPSSAVSPPAALPSPAARDPLPAQIMVRLGSEPAGALVTDTKRGVVIGATPFEHRVDRNQGSLGVRLAKDGYANVDLDIPLGDDFEKTVRLEPKPASKSEAKKAARPSGRGSTHAAAAKPAVAKNAAPAAAAPAPTAPPPPQPAPPVAAPIAKPRTAEKW
jgi:hypothetical protein